MSNGQEQARTFEASLEALEQIVRQLEDGDLPLEKSLELFEQGIRLSRECQERLGVTSVVVTHDLASAYFVADRITFLYDHRIYRVGTVEEMRASGVPEIEEFLSAASLDSRSRP